MKSRTTALVTLVLLYTLSSGIAGAEEAPQPTKPDAVSTVQETSANAAATPNPNDAKEPWKEHWAKGAAFFITGKFPEAEPELIEALKLAKTAGYDNIQPDILHMLGLVYLQESKYDLAIQSLQDTIHLAKMHPEAAYQNTINEALISLGDAYRRQGLYEKALPFLLEAKAKMKPHEVGYQQLLENSAQTYEGLGKLAEAEAQFQALVTLAKESHRDDLRYGYLNRLSGIQLKRKEPKKLLTTMTELYPFVVKEFGPNSNEVKNFKKNMAYTRQAAQQPVRYSGTAKIWMSCMAAGNGHMKAKQYTRAVQDFQKAATLAERESRKSPQTAIAKLNLGVAYGMAGYFKEAEAQMGQGLPILKQQGNILPAQQLAKYNALYMAIKLRNQQDALRNF